MKGKKKEIWLPLSVSTSVPDFFFTCSVSLLIAMLGGLFLTDIHKTSITQHVCLWATKCDFCDNGEPVDHLSGWGRIYFLTVLL